MPTPLDVLTQSRYLLLTTFRRDGREVPTPVWTARRGDELVVWTGPGTGKVKRIRREGRVTVAPCRRFGEPLGRSIDGRARLLDDAEVPGVLELLQQKYGWQLTAALLPQRIGRLLGRPTGRAAAIAIRVPAH